MLCPRAKKQQADSCGACDRQLLGGNTSSGKPSADRRGQRSPCSSSGQDGAAFGKAIGRYAGQEIGHQ